MSDIPLKRLRALAEYGGFVQNAYWRRRLAKIYREAAYVNAAIKEYSISIKLNEYDVAALNGMSYCYEKRKDYLAAIEWTQKALAASPQESRVENARMLREIAEWRQFLADKDGAIESSHAAYSLSPQDIYTPVVYLHALDRNSQFQEIMDFAADLKTKDSAQEGENMLVYLFVGSWGEAHDFIGHAARRLGRIDLVEQPMRDANAAADRRKSSARIGSSDWCLLGWANFLNKYAYKVDETIETCEMAMDHFPRPKTANSYVRSRMRSILCQLYYHKAETAESAGTQFDQWVSRLEGLVKTDNEKDTREFNTYKDPFLMLGLWYRLHGKEQDAKKCFRTQVLNGIDILTDDDPENDLNGYVTLAQTLLKAGDKENAAAAFAVTLAPLQRIKDSRRAAQKASDKSKASSLNIAESPLQLTDGTTASESLNSLIEEPETIAPMEKARVTNGSADDNSIATEDDFDLDPDEMTVQIKENVGNKTSLWVCDGRCNRQVEDWQELHFCEICTGDTCFCDECIKLVKTGTLPFNKCDAGHSFYQAYPVSPDLQDIATVRTGGEVLPRTEWLQALRNEWVA